MRRIALSIMLTAFLAGGASAQSVTSDEILKKLAPPAPAGQPTTRTRSLGAPGTPDPATKARTRAIQILEAGAPAAPAAPAPIATAPGAAPQIPTPTAAPTAVVVKPELVEEFKQVKAELPKIDLRITFEFDSDRPTPQGMQELHQLGLALLQIPTGKFVLIGHTDARGSHQYNDWLSRRRALAVAQILVSHYKIPASRLVTTGMGERQLIAGIHPDHEANRRVEVVNLGE